LEGKANHYVLPITSLCESEKFGILSLARVGPLLNNSGHHWATKATKSER
jgi:hypothetical protein